MRFPQDYLSNGNSLIRIEVNLGCFRVKITQLCNELPCDGDEDQGTAGTKRLYLDILRLSLLLIDSPAII